MEVSRIIFVYLFIIFNCAGSSLLHEGFLQLQQARATLRCSTWSSHCSDFIYFRAQAVGIHASLAAARRLNSCVRHAGSRACRLQEFYAGPQLLGGMWKLPGSGIKPVFLALAGRFLSTVPPGKSQNNFFMKWAK